MTESTRAASKSVEIAFWRMASEIRRILNSNLSDAAKLEQIENEVRNLGEDVASGL